LVLLKSSINVLFYLYPLHVYIYTDKRARVLAILCSLDYHPERGSIQLLHVCFVLFVLFWFVFNEGAYLT